MQMMTSSSALDVVVRLICFGYVLMSYGFVLSATKMKLEGS